MLWLLARGLQECQTQQNVESPSAQGRGDSCPQAGWWIWLDLPGPKHGRPYERVTMYPNLKLQLFKTGMRQNRLAQRLGLDESILSKLINGFRAPTPELREKIASLLHSDPEWLFQEAEVPRSPGESGSRSGEAPNQPLQLRRSSEPI